MGLLPCFIYSPLPILTNKIIIFFLLFTKVLDRMNAEGIFRIENKVSAGNSSHRQFLSTDPGNI